MSNLIESLNAAFLTDGYKLDHRRQYPKGTTLVYSNLTPRTCNYYPVANEGAVVFGIQYAIKHYLVEWFNESFFARDVDEICKEYQELLDSYLGPNNIGTDHIRALHELGYLPIRIKALPEGSLCPLKVPMMTVENTHPDFFWLTNYLETLLSTAIWLPTTSATTARLFKKELVRHAKKTGFDSNDLSFLCHDFSMRGMGDVVSGMASAMGHLTSFNGTENLTSLIGIKKYYETDYRKTPIAGTVPATEHSVMCAGGMDDEFGTFKRLITETYPNGFVSIVSDTWDFWKVITLYLPRLKDVIMARNGRVVIRPDSGDPADIICGVQKCDTFEVDGVLYYCKNFTKSEAQFQEETYKLCRKDPSMFHALTWAELKGAYECLYDTFGGSHNDKGYIELDPHIGMIYGDSITLDVQKDVYRRLEEKGFAASNLVMGIGSYTYQLKSRDTLGMAIKATYCEINGVPHEIFKEPKTDSRHIKKSLKGLLQVVKQNNTYVVKDQVTREEEQNSALQTVFENGVVYNNQNLLEIRERVNDTI